MTLYVVDDGALAVEFTLTSKTQCPAVIVVFAVPAVGPKVTEPDGQDAPAEAPAVADMEKPRSVAMRTLVTFTAEPISAW